jgi:hypothetical protein
VPGPQAGVLSAQPGYLELELDDPGDPGQVEPVGQQLADANEPSHVGLAVETGAARSPVRVDEAAALVDPQVLDLHRGHLGGHRNGELALLARNHTPSSQRSHRRGLDITFSPG